MTQREYELGYRNGFADAKAAQPSQAGELSAKAKVLREFLKQASYLKHPQVAYFGTIEGDSEEAWELRLYEAAIAAINAKGGN